MKTIRITVLLVERFEKPKEWKLEMPRGMIPKHAAETVYRISNLPPQFLSETEREILEKFPRTGLRSVSVGDMLIIEDEKGLSFRHFATVEGNGFKFH